MRAIQQGDVRIRLHKGPLPEGATRLDHSILAEGEATGHTHQVIGESVTLWLYTNLLYIDAPAGAVITHNTHKSISVPPTKPGKMHEVEIVREYLHFEEEARSVRRVVD
ncbi:MAG: hypothetical protein ACLQPD_37015 [Desulfomonilaceae bacterium]